MIERESAGPCPRRGRNGWEPGSRGCVSCLTLVEREDVLHDALGRDTLSNRGAMCRVHGTLGCIFGLHELLGVLPDLRGVGAKREPQPDEVGLESANPPMTDSTHQEQNGGTAVHQSLDLILIKWVVDRIRVFVIALVALPSRVPCDATRRVRASLASQLKLYIS